MAKKREISNKGIAIFGFACLVIVLILIIPWVTVTTEIQCVTTPCDPIMEKRSPFGIIKSHFEDKHTTLDDLSRDGDACIQIYSPVCGVDLKTYANQCIANANGVEVRYTGECPQPYP